MIVAAIVSTVCFADVAGKVTRVSDGDTIWVIQANGLRTKVRMNKIDAPESDQPWGEESTARLKALVYQKQVVVKGDTHDKYGRFLGVVFLGEDEINLRMVKEGHAWHYAYHDNTKSYADAQAEAKKSKRGLWSQPNPVTPYEWRKGKK